MANLGYIGLGVMGGRMADRLLSKGHSIFVTDPWGTYIELMEGLDKVQ